MDLYVANGTRQHQEFVFRLPERPQEISQRIQMGGQIQVTAPRDGLSTKDIDAVISQKAPYGMAAIDQVSRIKGIVPLAYQIGRPITANQLKALLLHNDGYLAIEGRKLQAISAASLTAQVEKDLLERESPAKLGRMDITIVEVEPPKGYSDDHDPVGVGFEINRRQQQDGGRRRRRGRE